MSESKTKLYKIRLNAGFPANRRQRAGFDFIKGAEPRVESLTQEQVEALEADEWIQVVALTKEEVKAIDEKAEADKKAKEERLALEAEANAGSGSDEDETEEDTEEVVDISTLKRGELETIATELEIENATDKTVFPNRETLIEAIRAKQAENDENGSDEDETEE